MTSNIANIANITFDAPGALTLAQFWGEVLGWNIGAESSEAEASLRAPDGGIGSYFMQVPEDKQVKNRDHLDVTPDDDSAQEVHRLTRLGATLVSRQPGFLVLADPAGNEFCLATDAQ